MITIYVDTDYMDTYDAILQLDKIICLYQIAGEYVLAALAGIKHILG